MHQLSNFREVEAALIHCIAAQSLLVNIYMWHQPYVNDVIVLV